MMTAPIATATTNSAAVDSPPRGISPQSLKLSASIEWVVITPEGIRMARYDQAGDSRRGE